MLFFAAASDDQACQAQSNQGKSTGLGNCCGFLSGAILVDFIDLEDNPLKTVKIINSMFVDTSWTRAAKVNELSTKT